MTTETITSPSGRSLLLRTARTTTPQESAEAKIVRIKLKRSTRLTENEALLAGRNVAAFLKAIAEAEGGGYDFKYGAVRGKRKDPWRFSDYSTHPGPGFGGQTTAAKQTPMSNASLSRSWTPVPTWWSMQNSPVAF